VPSSDLFRELLVWSGLLLSAGFGNPIPEELIIISAGIRTAHMDDYGVWRWLMLPVCIVAALIADVMLYGIGRAFGEMINRTPFLSRLIPPEKQERIRENLHRYGVVIFVIGRLIPGIRSTLFLTAGSIHLPLWKFCLADGIGGLIGIPLFYFLGYTLGEQFRDLIESLENRITPYRTIILIVLLSAVGAYLLYRYLRQPIPTGDPEEVPLIGHQIATHLPAASDNGEAPAPAREGEAPAEPASQGSPEASPSRSEQSR
jgi:membrane protein DedA with SNARE-associated domain